MEIEWKIDMSCAKNSQSENASFGQGSHFRGKGKK